MITFRRLGHFGRFGNQLFQYSGTRLYAESNGFNWAFPPWIGDRLFQIPKKPTKCYHSLLPTIQLADMRSTSWSERFLHPLGLWRRGTIDQLYAHPENNVSLYGYMQDETSLKKIQAHRDRVQTWFRFRPEIDAAFHAATKGMSWVGLHVRRGDYIGAGCAIPVQIYLDTLVRIRGNLPVYVATDDSAVRHELAPDTILNVPNPLPDLYAYVPNDLFDFWMLQHATTVIGGGSTFSWWAAFLGTHQGYYAPPLTHLWIGRNKAPPPITYQKF